MRKFTLIFIGILLLFVTESYAQASFATDRGSMYLGGSIYFSSSGGEALEDSYGDRTSRISLNPDFMIFVAPSLAIGAELQFSTYSSGDTKSQNFGIGPSVTYYIAGHKEKSLYPYIGVSYLFSTSSYENTSSDYTDDSRNSTSQVKAGLLVMLSNAVALNAEFNYQSITYDLGIGIKAFIF